MVTKVKLKHKKTDVGVIPSDWIASSLGSVASINMGQSPSSQSYNRNRKGLPLIQGKADIKNRKSIIRFWTSEPTKTCEANDILLTVRAPVGSVGIASHKSCIGRGVCSISPVSIDHDYLYHNLIFRESSWKELEQGSTFTAANSDQIKSFKLAFPKKESEQKNIAIALSNSENLIEILTIIIAKKQALKRGTMQLLLTGKKRLKGFKRTWKLKKVHSFTDVVSGGTPSTLNPEYWNGSIRWMSSGELNNKRIHDVEGRITQEGLDNSSTQLVPSQCVLIGLAGQGKTRGTVAINYVRLCTNQSIAAFLPNDSFSSEFLYHYLDSKYDELRGLSTGDGGRGGLNLTILRNLEVNIPSDVKEQEAIATVLNSMDEEIQSLKQKRDKYLLIKKGMMQQLLTGSIRLK